MTLNGHGQSLRSLAWTPDGTRLVSSSNDGTVRVWDSRSVYNYEAELLLDRLSERDCVGIYDGTCLLLEEVVEELKADRSISAELRREAMQLATERGNAPTWMLQLAAWKTGINPNRPGPEYVQALRRVTVASRIVPWWGRVQLTLGLLEYRTGDLDQALLSSQRAMELQKSQAPDAHAIRAMAYYRLHDLARAQSELALARQASRSEFAEDSFLLEEAESQLSQGKTGILLRR